MVVQASIICLSLEFRHGVSTLEPHDSWCCIPPKEKSGCSSLDIHRAVRTRVEERGVQAIVFYFPPLTAASR